MSTWYRRNVSMRKGHKEYTNCGYAQAKKNFINDDLDVDCSDKHYLITGSNRGIGLETALEVSRRGGIVHLLCRNRASMLEARSHIITTTGNDKLHLHTLDLSRPRDVGRWAQDFVSTHNQLDVLINNAGTMAHERVTDDDGIETTFAVNTLSIHLLTIILLPLLQRSPEPRVITVSSSDLLQVKLDSDDFSFEKMEPFDGHLAYAQTKRQQVVMNICYGRRYDRVRFYSMHPGWVDTKLLKKSQTEFYSLMQNSLRTPNQGADTIVWLAVSQAALKHSSGTFFQDRNPVSLHLPLAWTKHTPVEERKFMQRLDKQLAAVSAYCYNIEESNESGFGEGSNETSENEFSQCQESSSNSNSSQTDSDVESEPKTFDLSNPNTVEHSTSQIKDDTTKQNTVESCTNEALNLIPEQNILENNDFVDDKINNIYITSIANEKYNDTDVTLSTNSNSK